MKLASQLRSFVLPIKAPVKRDKARAITEDEKKFKAFTTLRRARADQRLKGYREKKAKDAADEAK